MKKGPSPVLERILAVALVAVAIACVSYLRTGAVDLDRRTEQRERLLQLLLADERAGEHGEVSILDGLFHGARVRRVEGTNGGALRLLPAPGEGGRS